MKTKLLIATLIGVGLASNANALTITTAEIEQRCNSSTKTVWDSKNNQCLPRAVCRSKTAGHEIYCNKVFEDIQTNSLDIAKGLVALYVSEHYNSTCEFRDTDEQERLFGQDEVGCTMSDGSYISFEFDDTWDKKFDRSATSTAKGICLAFDYSFERGGWCVGVKDINTCDRIRNSIRQIGTSYARRSSGYYNPDTYRCSLM